MSRSRWLGQEPRSVTTYEYDESTGRLIRSVTETESAWTDEDRGWLLAYLAEKTERCAGCGNHLDECRDPATAGRWSVIAERCEPCRVGEAEAENRAEAARNSPVKQRGIYYAVRLND